MRSPSYLRRRDREPEEGEGNGRLGTGPTDQFDNPLKKNLE